MVTHLLCLLTLAAVLAAHVTHAHVGDEIYPYTVRNVTFEIGANGNLGTGFALRPPGSQREAGGTRGGGPGPAAQAVSNSAMTES